MNEEEIFEKVKEIIIDHLGVEEEKVKKDSTLTDDLAADSLDIVEVIMELEETFEIEIPDEDAEKITTVGDVAKYIASKI